MEENTRSTEVVHEITPKFNFIYELGMPTGRKIKSTLFLLFIFLAGYIVYLVGKGKMGNSSTNLGNIDIMNVLNIVLILGMIFSVVKIIIHVIFQNAQYKNIKYTFYNDHMTYEDSFLNQHKKNIEYANVKEEEIRRSVWDRIMGYGIIVIYTNAENEYSNGLVIFGIENPKVHYDIIDKLVHSPTVKGDTTKIDNENNINLNQEKIENPKETEMVEERVETHEEFLESLKNVQNNVENNNGK